MKRYFNNALVVSVRWPLGIPLAFVAVIAGVISAACIAALVKLDEMLPQFDS